MANLSQGNFRQNPPLPRLLIYLRSHLVHHQMINMLIIHPHRLLILPTSPRAWLPWSLDCLKMRSRILQPAAKGERTIRPSWPGWRHYSSVANWWQKLK